MTARYGQRILHSYMDKEMEGKRFIRTLRLQNFLSYGSEGEEIELQPLNVAEVREAAPSCDRLFTTLTQIMGETI